MPDPAKLKAIVGVDRLVHEPARLAILSALSVAAEVDFKSLGHVTGLTKGNLSSHTAKLEMAGYVQVIKRFRGRTPSTGYRLTSRGREAFRRYTDDVRAALPDATAPSNRSRKGRS